jgi:hypothetical protein
MTLGLVDKICTVERFSGDFVYLGKNLAYIIKSRFKRFLTFIRSHLVTNMHGIWNNQIMVIDHLLEMRVLLYNRGDCL